MARLPVPGADNDNWGSVLNDFLLTSLNPDGTQKFASLPAGAPNDLTVDATTYSNTFTGTGTYTTAVFASPEPALVSAEQGDGYPQWVVGSGAGEFLSLGDGTLDPITSGAHIWSNPAAGHLSGVNLTLLAAGARVTVGQTDPIDDSVPTTTIWSDFQLTNLQQTVGVVFRARQGNPNGTVAGRQGDIVIDGQSPALWQCTTTGDSTSAVWALFNASANVVGQYLGVEASSFPTTSGVGTDVTFTGTTATNGSDCLLWDASTPDRIQVLQAGVYAITGVVYWRDSGVSGPLLVSIFTECGFLVTDQRAAIHDGVSQSIQPISTTLYLRAGDNILLSVEQGSGSTLTSDITLLATRVS